MGSSTVYRALNLGAIWPTSVLRYLPTIGNLLVSLHRVP